MITEKDKEDAKIICSAIKIPIELSIGGLKIVTTVSTGEILAKLNSETIAQILYGIRAESADQTRKESADRVCKRCPFGTCEDKDFCRVRASILDRSVVIEPLTADANKKDDHVPDTGKKLAIAVKALEEIVILGTHKTLPGRTLNGERRESETITNQYAVRAGIALKEIQG